MQSHSKQFLLYAVCARVLYLWGTLFSSSVEKWDDVKINFILITNLS